MDWIGPKRRERIAQGWPEAKQVREIMLFLHSHGVSTSRAVRIFKTYGEQAIAKVRENPYTQNVLANRVVVTTGGPGVGKTTLVNSILMILGAKA